MRLLPFVVCALGMLVWSERADAQFLYGFDQDYYRIDPNTGNSVLLANHGPQNVLGLAYRPSTQTMYGLPLGGRIFTFDPATGAQLGLVATFSNALTGLTFNQDFSRLYTTTTQTSTPQLAYYDLANSNTVTVGDLGTNVIVDVAMNSAGNLYGGGFGGLYSINALTGAATLVGGTHDWGAVAFDNANTLYGIDIAADALYRIDPLTGNSFLIGGDIGSDIRGLTFIPAAVPEPSTYALLGMTVTALWYIRRRRKCA